MVNSSPLFSLWSSRKIFTSLKTWPFISTIRTPHSGTIPQEAIVPGTSQEQQQHSTLPKGCFMRLDYHLNTTGTHQNPTAHFSSIENQLVTIHFPYKDSITYSGWTIDNLHIQDYLPILLYWRNQMLLGFGWNPPL